MIAFSISKTWRISRPLCRHHAPSRYSTSSTSPNAGIVSLLEKARNDLIASPTYDPYRVKQYTIALNRIREHKETITNAAEAMKALKTSGQGVIGLVVMYLETGKTNISAEELKEKSRVHAELLKAAKELRKAPGIGLTRAMELASKGCYSLSQLHEPKFQQLLTPHVRKVLEWYDVTRQHATLEQAQAITDFIRDNLSQKFEVVLAGSHRRGQTSETINILLFHPNYVYIPTPSDNGDETQRKRETNNAVTGKVSMEMDVIHTLRSRGLIAADASQGVRVWKGIARVPQKDDDQKWESRWDRLEGIQAKTGEFRSVEIVYVFIFVSCILRLQSSFRLAPVKSRGAALLVNTGDRNFCTDMMDSAKRLGMHLDDFGLWRREEPNTPLPADDLSENITPTRPNGHWLLIAGETEESIFEELNRPFVEPEKRNFGFLATAKKPRLRDVPNSRKGRPKVKTHEEEPPKRPRGRPRKSTSSADDSS
ncbi:hypothetical protein BXZ70DRAFT_1080272 [Cristinia sonorae]|uniref:DNA-directed DNA polymerase X domain-containing protein n=1 Tax=Cristinia sonorae TaxID=1940300 RepID=A0A8K0XKY8_9AGAR|nr:hypothetical protein BXZ70DRAFT_1080272 [Cristinia sonorae]